MEVFSDIQMFMKVEADNKLCTVLDQGMHEELNFVHIDIRRKESFRLNHRKVLEVRYLNNLMFWSINFPTQKHNATLYRERREEVKANPALKKK